MSRQLFTGPFARQLLVQDPKRKGESQNEKEKWKIFVLLKKDKQGLVLNKDSEVLYQVYTINPIDKPCMDVMIQMLYCILYIRTLWCTAGFKLSSWKLYSARR